MKLNEIKSYCIHLSKRTDREVHMKDELSKFKLDTEIFEGIYSPQGYIGISSSFKNVIRDAIKNDYPYILIFEDDVKFTSEKSNEQFQKCIDSLPDDWDILLGGVYTMSNSDYESDVISECLKPVTDFSSLHCTLIRNTMYNHILNHDPARHLPNIDRYISHIIQKENKKAYVSYPMIAIQYNGYSDNVNGNVNYDRLLASFKLFR